MHPSSQILRDSLQQQIGLPFDHEVVLGMKVELDVFGARLSNMI
jgi:hypothetical protein